MKATQKPAAPELSSLRLTINERDQIDACRARLRGCLGAIEALDGEDVPIADEVLAVARLVQVDVMRESLDAIDATFKAADDRKETAGGAR